MKLLSILFVSFAVVCLGKPHAKCGGELPKRPLNIAHRGSSGMMPEHTVAGYKLAVEQGADVIECDLCITKDLQLICLHEGWIKHVTDVEDHPEFKNRLQTKHIIGHGNITDYFTPDFTLAELKTLRKKQHLSFRDQQYNGQFTIATFEEYVRVAQGANSLNKTVGIYPEVKDPKWVNSLEIMRAKNLKFEDIAIAALAKYGYSKKSDNCYVQCFDEDAVKYMATKTDLKLIMLIEADISDAKLDELSKICHGIGPWKDQIVKTWSKENGYKNQFTKSDISDFVQRVHARNLKIHPYTFRAENKYLAPNFGQDIHAEFELFHKLGIDGFFTDFPKSLSRYFKNASPNAVPDFD